MVKFKKAMDGVLILSMMVLLLCSCGSAEATADGTKNSSNVSVSVNTVPKASEPSVSVSPTAAPTDSPAAQTPEPEKPLTVWDLLGSEAKTFADSFSEEQYAALEYTFYGEGGANVAVTENKERIREVFQALCEITVLEQTDVMADDFDEVFRFKSEGSSFAVRFNMHHLDVGGTYYVLENDDALWNAAERIAEEDPASSESSLEPVVSEGMNFSFDCSNALETEEDTDGRISVYLHSGINSHPYVRVGRLSDGKNAMTCLSEMVEGIQSTYSGNPSSEDGRVEMIQIDGRDLYKTALSFTMDDLEMSFAGYAEDYEDGTVVYYCALFEKQYEALASDVLSTAIHSIWVGELEEEKDSSNEPKKQKAGRFTFTEMPLASGDIEYCIDDALILTIPQSWTDKVFWAGENDVFNFYHKATYERYAKEGGHGGLLFSIAFYPDNSYEYLPDYQYLGLARGGHYIMVFPSDEQAYTKDEEILSEWNELFHSITYILDNTYSMIFQ